MSERRKIHYVKIVTNADGIIIGMITACGRWYRVKEYKLRGTIDKPLVTCKRCKEKMPEVKL